MQTMVTQTPEIQTPEIQTPEIQSGFVLKASKKRKDASGWIYFVSFAIIVFLLLYGYSYYSTPYAERPHHENYRELRPAGRLGLIYGIAGATMMVVMLVYTMRKRTRLIGQKPSVRSYLNFHIYLGIFGPLMVTLHTSFKVQGLVAIGYWSMIAVVLSGFFGRFLYRQIPRNINDQELSLKQIEELMQQINDVFKQRGEIYEEAYKLLITLLEKIYAIGDRGALRAMVRLMFLNLLRPFIRRGLRKEVRLIVPITGTQYNELFDSAQRQAVLRLQVSILFEVQRFFHYWHVIHKPFAIIMYVIMGIHIAVAIWTGYGWLN